MAGKCKECGCICKQCYKSERKLSDMHLHEEIENLRQCLAESQNHIVNMETHFLNEAEKFPNGELASLKEELLLWEEKYLRLFEAHKRVQKVNQNLEDKLLKIVDKCETEKSAFTKDIATLSHRLAEANHTIHQLTQDNEKYRKDVNLAIQLLQCKPSNFIEQKYESLSPEVQSKVRAYVSQRSSGNDENSNSEVRSITVPISTFPPTAMVYNIAKPVVDKQEYNREDDSKPPIDIVSSTIMAKILEDREKDRIFTRHCNTCSCHRSILKVDTESQTDISESSIINSAKDCFVKCDNDNFTITKNLHGQSHQGNKNQNVVHSHKLEPKLDQMNLKNFDKASIDKIDAKKLNNLDDQTKLNVINERLWKNSARAALMAKDDPVQLDVINERTWRPNGNPSKVTDPPRLTVIEVKSSDDLTNQSENMQTETATSLSVSNDSIVISSSDPSSLSSDLPINPTNNLMTQSSNNNNNNNSSSSGKKERAPSGPRNCSIRLTPGSNNILLDNAGTYETVLYTTGYSKTNTALVLVPKSTSSRSGRSPNLDSGEENDNSHLQRVAQWVDTISNDDNNSSNGNNNNSAHPKTSTFSSILSSDPTQDPLLSNSTTSRSKPQKFSIGATSTLTMQDVEEQKDLISFEGFSDDEHNTTTEFSMNYDQQDNISKQIEETYMKLAADFDTLPSTVKQNYTKIDMMTVEEYRKKQKQLHKSTQAKFSSLT